MPTEASAAWLDDDVTTGWPVLAGKQSYLIALAEPELVSNFSVSAKAADGTISLYAGDEPGAPGAKSWTPLAENIALQFDQRKETRPSLHPFRQIHPHRNRPDPTRVRSTACTLYGEKPSTIYDLRQREQPIDAHAIFGQVNDKTAFNANGLFTGSTVLSANSPDGSLAWQKAIDDNPGNRRGHQRLDQRSRRGHQVWHPRSPSRGSRCSPIARPRASSISSPSTTPRRRPRWKAARRP
ncbi:MAG: hypothetical protein WDN28_23895 [Chthoniobacter sp.]